MKKSLLALAVAAALPAIAQAQTNVTLYGIADAAVEFARFDNGVETVSDVRVTNGVWSGSRVGLQGSEDLGGGLRGIFNFEHRISIDTGTQTNAGLSGTSNPAGAVSGNVTGSFWQQSYVGLAGGFGEIRLGRDYTVGFRALQPGDMTGYSFYNNAFGLAGTVGRISNAVQYISPSLGGFKLWGLYGAGEAYGSPDISTAVATTAAKKTGDTFQIGGVGNFGPVGLGLYYSSAKANESDNIKEFGGSLGAKFGGFGVGAAYAQRKLDVDGSAKTKGLYLSTSYAIGASTIYLIGKREETGDAENTGLGLSYTYAISKRTLPYFSFGYNSIDSGVPGSEKRKPLAVALGLRHYF